ncbi:Os10g0207400 [Oryza sativa Japonica Group]|uniref:Os10g0207400 protein n=2 Tax=Oryza sativa subsp. japonica TaxID=39947 RepID=C7J834_ORYSJ|nr:hypothetical protein OsJ_31023 [Oryza sativa Japonica Group]BAH94797.1 Os10g0207400 [Oryza sativa Japonica Group]BAT10261.1 Os10g0207400 [Oryza sativa Japonica Group]|eukprot:NP_001176069.1 Os10g0207400 [Oryza sativa Japonica Group]
MALTAPVGWIRRWLWHRRLPLANPAEAAAVLFLAGGFGGGFSGGWIQRFSTPSSSPSAPKLVLRRWHQRSHGQIWQKWWRRRF